MVWWRFVGDHSRAIAACPCGIVRVRHSAECNCGVELTGDADYKIEENERVGLGVSHRYWVAGYGAVVVVEKFAIIQAVVVVGVCVAEDRHTLDIAEAGATRAALPRLSRQRQK